MGERRRVFRATSVAILSSAITLVATSCSTVEPPKARPQTTADPTLAAAIDAYTRYSAALDVIRSQPPREQDPSSLRATVTEEFWTVLEKEIEADDRTWLQRGSSAFGDEELVDTVRTADQVSAIINVCVDLTHTTLVNEHGTEIPAPDRRLEFPMQVTLEGGAASTFLVADTEALEVNETCGV